LIIIKQIYRILPIKIRFSIRQILKFFLYKFRYLTLKLAIFFNKEIKLIIGAALTSQKGWYSTNEEWLDVSNPEHWKRLFKGKDNLKCVMAEHVFEHLTEKEMRIAIKLIHKYLYKNGHLRIAVPDGNHPNPEYRLNTGINGIGPDAADHKQFITYEFMKMTLENNGFECQIKEGYLDDGNLVESYLDNNLGFIMRSRRNFLFKKNSIKTFYDSNTSLIVDATKA